MLIATSLLDLIARIVARNVTASRLPAGKFRLLANFCARLRFPCFHPNFTIGHHPSSSASGQTIRASIRTTDTVARLGGDEFALLPPETDDQPAYAVISKLRRILLETIQSGHSNVTVSIGPATFEVPGESIDEIIKIADDLMYSAKKQGKNCVATSYVKSDPIPAIWLPRHFTPHFHFETPPPNLWIVAIINIHAGVKAMKTLERSVPWVRNKISPFSSCSMHP